MQARRVITISRVSTRKLYICCCEFSEKSDKKAQKVCILRNKVTYVCHGDAVF